MARPKSYSGVLAEPIVFSSNEPNSAHNVLELMQRHIALLAHYGIDLRRPGAMLKLAEAMADRHERDPTRRSAPPRLSAVFDKYGIDPESGSGHLDLVLALARKHVPGFGRKPDAAAGRWTTQQMATLIDCVLLVCAQLEEDRRRVSDHAITDILLDERKLKKAIGKAWANELSRILQKKRDSDGHKGLLLSKSTLRCCLRDMRGAPRAFLSGTATPFQQRYLRAASIYRETAMEYEAKSATGQKSTSKQRSIRA